jgi:hypothetical protein
MSLSSISAAQHGFVEGFESMAVGPWLFPGVLPGRHLVAQSITTRRRSLGINLLGARKTALQSLAAEVPPPLVAELLGYSYNVVQRHAEIAAQQWASYVTSRRPPQVPAASLHQERGR